VQRVPGLCAGSAPGRGTFIDIAVDQAHVDGNLVTAPAWPAHPAWLAAFLKVLGTRIA
jgi:protease I